MDFAAGLLNGLAGLLLAALPAALLFWLLIHPFAAFWRRLGAVTTYVIVSSICLAVVAAIWTQREGLLGPHLGYRAWTLGLGAALVVTGAIWDWKVLKKLSFPVLAGVPELSESRPSRLLTDGPYARVRHPRYFGALVGILGFALICNTLGLYAVVAASIPVGWLMVRFEERELEQRFGDEYVEYSRRVPRFVPRGFGLR